MSSLTRLNKLAATGRRKEIRIKSQLICMQPLASVDQKPLVPFSAPCCPPSVDDFSLLSPSFLRPFSVISPSFLRHWNLFAVGGREKEIRSSFDNDPMGGARVGFGGRFCVRFSLVRDEGLIYILARSVTWELTLRPSRRGQNDQHFCEATRRVSMAKRWRKDGGGGGGDISERR